MSLPCPSLTPNAVRDLINRTDKSFRPVVQAISVRHVNQQTQDRYRVVVSDGTVFVQGMLATQANHLVTRPDMPLETGSIFRVNDCMTNLVSGRTILILLDLEVVGPPMARIGASVELGTEPANNNVNNGPAAVAPMYNRTNTAGAAGAAAAAPHYAAAAGGAPSNNSGSNPYASPSGNNPYSPAKRSNNNPIVQNNMGGGAAGGGGPRITLISQLNMYQNKFTIKARVTAKSDIRTWSNAKGEGSLFSIELLDSSGMDIRATMFKDAVEKYYNYFEVGKVYTITSPRLKVANMAYNTCKSSLEMTIDHQQTEVHLVDDVGDIQEQSYDFVKIGALEQVEEKRNVDILAIVQEVGEVQSLTSKKTGNELLKCDLTLIDDTGVQVRLTMWGKAAQEAATTFGGSGAPSDRKIAAFRRARVSDYGGKTLSGGDAHLEPNIPEAEALRQWWTSQGSRSGPTKSLSSSGGAGGRMDSFADRKQICDIKNQHLGYIDADKGDYLCFKAHFTFLKKDKEGGAWYTACPNKEEPCRNRCKVTQTTDGNWQCDRCHGTYPNCSYKWIFSGTVSDETSSTWVSIFDEQAHQMFGGVTADEAQANFGDQNAYDSHFAKAVHTEWIFKCRVKSELVNDEPRLKAQVVRMDPVDYASECREMIAALEKM